MRLRRPTHSEQMNVPMTGRMIVAPDEAAPAGSLRRISIITSDSVAFKIDGGIEDIARTRAFAWPTVPEKTALQPFYLQPQQFVGAIAPDTGVATITVIVEYFDAE